MSFGWRPKTAEYFAVPADQAVWDGNELDVASTKSLAVMKTFIKYYLDGKIKSKTSYDYDGSVLAISEFDYDSRGRVKEIKQLINDNDLDETISDDDDVAETSYEYSDDGDLERVSGDDGYHIVIDDAEGKRTGIAINYLGKPTIVTYPSGDYEEYVYYDYIVNPFYYPDYFYNGLLKKTAVWEDGEKYYIGYEYDECGKVTRITYPNNSGYIQYGYTNRILGKYGLVETIIDRRNADDRPDNLDGTYMFTYDTLSEKLKSYTDPDKFTFNYGYNDPWNQVCSIDVRNPYNDSVYAVNYNYDLAGRVTSIDNIIDPNNPPDNPITTATFEYDLNGNRSRLTYYPDGDINGPAYGLNYTYNVDNLLTNIETFGTAAGSDNAVYTFDADDAEDIDGLGRLRLADEVITDPAQSPKSLSFVYNYDMMSQLVHAKATNVGGHEYIEESYTYAEDGNISQWMRTVKDSGQDSYNMTTSFGYSGDLMTGAAGTGGADSFTLDTDENGNTIELPADTTVGNDEIVYNWNNKLRSASRYVDPSRTDSIHVKYDPMGNRVWKSSTVNGVTTTRKYIVDINGKLPTILCIIDASDPNLLISSYTYAGAQVLAQRRYPVPADPTIYDAQFYVYDRLGSVRLVVDYNDIDAYVFVANSYTYTPFGSHYDGEAPTETVSNPFKFTGQWHDAEINQYYLRARMYDPAMMRFTSRDPHRGDRNEPLTLHRYLYCINNSTNRVDPSGEISTAALRLTNAVVTGASLYGHGLSLAAYSVDTGDDRFWTLANVTFDFMPIGAAIASLNPYGPAANLATSAAIHLNQMAYGSTTGMSTVQGLAVDPLAFLVYRYVMGTAHKYIGTNANDMQNFMSWMGVDWVERINNGEL